MRRWKPAQLAAYALVIVVCTGLDVTCVFVLRKWLPLLLAVLAGFLAQVVGSYVLSRRLVFLRATRGHANASWRFAVLVGVNVLIGVGGVTAMASAGMPYLGARALSSAVLVPLNFVVAGTWVFVEAD